MSINENIKKSILLEPINNSFEDIKFYELNNFEKIKIGRQISTKTMPLENNGYFSSKVLSRNHAELWLEQDKVNKSYYLFIIVFYKRY